MTNGEIIQHLQRELTHLNEQLKPYEVLYIRKSQIERAIEALTDNYGLGQDQIRLTAGSCV